VCVMQTTKCVMCDPIVWYHRNWRRATPVSAAVVVTIGRHVNSTRKRQHSRIASERDRADAIFVCDYRNGTRQRKYAAVPRAHPSGRCCSCSTAARECAKRRAWKNKPTPAFPLPFRPWRMTARAPPTELLWIIYDVGIMGQCPIRIL